MLRRQRKSAPTDIQMLIVGLGNPGEKYKNTRHNVGFDALDWFADKHSAHFKKTKNLSLCSEIMVNSRKIILAKPTTYMNESGMAVQKLVKKYGLNDLEKMLIIHDELDLNPGSLKVKIGGGLAGHNGLKSIAQHMKSNDFGRLRIGIGRPSQSQLGKNYVLKSPSKSDAEKIALCNEKASEAIEKILNDGYTSAMNQFNGEIQ